nr:cytochrome P450 [Nostoc commune]
MNNLYQFFVKAYQQLDSIYKVYVPGRVLTVLGGPEANIFVSRKGINCFSTRIIYTDIAKELGVSLIAELDGEEHRRYRKIIEQFLSTNKVEQYIKTMALVILNLSNNWQLGQRWQVQVDDLIQKLTFVQLGLSFLRGQKCYGRTTLDYTILIKGLLYFKCVCPS